MVRSTEGEGDRVGTQPTSACSKKVVRGDPITLTLAAPRLDLSREAGEVLIYLIVTGRLAIPRSVLL